MKDLFSEINVLPCMPMTKEFEAPPDYLKYYRVRFFPLDYLVEVTKWADGRYVISHFTKDDIHEINEFKCKFKDGAIKPILAHLNECLNTNYTDIEYLKQKTMKKQNNWSEMPSGTLVLVRICGELRRCVFDKIDYDGIYIYVYNGDSFDTDCLSTSHEFVKHNWITSSIASI